MKISNSNSAPRLTSTFQKYSPHPSLLQLLHCTSYRLASDHGTGFDTDSHNLLIDAFKHRWSRDSTDGRVTVYEIEVNGLNSGEGCLPFHHEVAYYHNHR